MYHLDCGLELSDVASHPYFRQCFCCQVIGTPTWITDRDGKTYYRLDNEECF